MGTGTDSDNSGKTPAHPADVAPATAEQVSIARRRALLKGLGKGAALAGSAIPLRSLATGGDKAGMRLHKTDNKDYHCSVSGNMSVLLSGGVSIPPACAGKTCTYYKTRGNWPKYSTTPVCIVKKNGSNVYYNESARFCDVFNNPSASTHSIGWLIDNASTGPEAQWTVAMLNATVVDSSFPYSTAEVLALYTDASTRTSALTFFQTYLGGA